MNEADCIESGLVNDLCQRCHREPSFLLHATVATGLGDVPAVMQLLKTFNDRAARSIIKRDFCISRRTTHIIPTNKPQDYQHNHCHL